MSKTDQPSFPDTTAGASEERAPAFPLATGSAGLADDLSTAKFRLLLAESVLHKARRAVVSAEVDLRVAQLRLEAIQPNAEMSGAPEKRTKP